MRRDAAAAPAAAPGIVGFLEVGDDRDPFRRAFRRASLPVAAYVVLGGGVAGNLSVLALEMVPEHWHPLMLRC